MDSPCWVPQPHDTLGPALQNTARSQQQPSRAEDATRGAWQLAPAGALCFDVAFMCCCWAPNPHRMELGRPMDVLEGQAVRVTAGLQAELCSHSSLKGK